MESSPKKLNEESLDKVLTESWGELSHVNPVVLSCGGIYIPHQNEAQRIYYHILTTPNEEMPVKVITGVRPRNILQQVLARESMN